MDRRAQITATPLHVPSILVVLDPAWPTLFNICLSVASRCGVLLHRCAAKEAATIAAERRPLAIIMSNNVYALDPPDFDALARDVRATLLRLDEEVTERELEAMLSGALRDTGRRGEIDEFGEMGGRYTMISGRRSEAPGARRSDAPGPPSVAPPPSMRMGASSAGRTASTSRSVTPAPASGSPQSVRGPAPSARGATATMTATSRSVTPAPASGSPQSFASPPSSARGAPSSARTAPIPPSVPGGSFAGPPSSRPLSSPPPSVGARPSTAPLGPPPSSRALPTPPPSSRALPNLPPLSSRALPMPPSVRSIPSLPGSGAEKPPAIRTMTPLSQRMSLSSTSSTGTGRADPSPRSGVRECGSEELDALFEDQKLPLDALARGNRGTTPR